MRDVVLVGEYNPVSADPSYALYPSPPNCAGARLCNVLGLTAPAYLRRFHRRNLLAQERWSAPLARAAALALLEEFGEGAAFVLLGARVSAAFRVPFAPVTMRQVDPKLGLVYPEGETHRDWPFTATVLVVPHPSGRSRLWNDRKMGVRVRAAVERLSR